MNIAILLVTHEGIATPLLAAAERLLGHLPLPVGVFELPWDTSPDTALPAASAALRRVDSDAGVLLLTDLYGASPARLAAQLCHLGTPARRVSGLSLPMLLRVLNYAEQPLDELARIAASGGRHAIIQDEA